MQTIQLSVSKIVSLVLRSGDIDSRFRDAAAMHKGSAAHRKIQKESGKNYEKEVSLRLEMVVDGISLALSGRADGIITAAGGGIVIDEIKTTTLPIDVAFRQHQSHLAQGKCYAHMLLQNTEKPPAKIGVQLTYFQQESEEIRRYNWDFTAAELEEFFNDLIEKYTQWLRFERDWAIIRDESIAITDFPFPAYRRGQRELAVAAYRTIGAQKKLYVSAPTGIGKTLSTLFPAIKAMREGLAEKLFYLTAKTVTRAVAEDAIGLMAARGLRFKSVTLRAKEKICPNVQCICTPDACNRAKGHYERINDALLDLLENNDLIIPSLLSEYAQKHQVCPHEYELDASLWCDLVIGDYNHVFDPTVYLHRYFSSEKKYEDKNYVLLIDEAHNLVDRVRSMYSAVLSKSTFSPILRRLRGKDPMTRALRRALRGLDTYFADIATENGGRLSRANEDLDMVFKALAALFATSAGEWLASNKTGDHDLFNEVLNLFFDTEKFLLIADLYDSHFVSITEINSKFADVSITLFCLDPSKVVANMLNRGKAAVIFSATLAPLPYYRDILGGAPDDPMLSLPSPFDPDRLLTVAHCGISTKYDERQSSYIPIAEAIHGTISRRKGNYFAFFPSYEYMWRVYDLFTEKYPDIQTVLQDSEMSEEEREEFLQKFDSGNTETLVGFVVLGGIFSEGIDLKGDRLIGTIIISVGIPQVSLRQNLIRNYFDQKNGNGHDYAYTFPGINKILQAAGRVIRTETDSGIVLLIDSRYAQQKYKALLPAHWTDLHQIQSIEELPRTP